MAFSCSSRETVGAKKARTSAVVAEDKVAAAIGGSINEASELTRLIVLGRSASSRPMTSAALHPILTIDLSGIRPTAAFSLAAGEGWIIDVSRPETIEVSDGRRARIPPEIETEELTLGTIVHLRARTSQAE